MGLPPIGPLWWGAAYDADEPEGSRRSSSQYISGKDIRNVAIATILLGIALTPIYQFYRRQSERTTCGQNFKSIFDAMGLYAVENNDRYPPTHMQDLSGAPLLFDGKPYTWASVISNKMSPRRNFVCPSAHADEIVQCGHPDSNRLSLPTTYGMAAGLSTKPINLLIDPNNTVVVSETSNFGAQDTYNPVPFVNAEGQTVRQDGFLIGYDNSNVAPDGESVAATRLAFYGTGKGRFSVTNRARHDGRIHILKASGQLELVSAPAARVMHLGKDVTGLWSNR